MEEKLMELHMMDVRCILFLMNLLKTLKIKVPHGEVGVDVYALSGGDREANALKPKRVYTIAYNMRQEVVTIYNDKQHFWGFPGGHIEKICDTWNERFKPFFLYFSKKEKPISVFVAHQFTANIVSLTHYCLEKQ